MHHYTLRKLFIVSIVSVGFFAACTRITSTELGGDLIPAVDGVTTLDTIMDVVTENFALSDTISINKTDLQLLGAISNDPLFGKTRASLYFELKPEAYPFEIPGTKDSVVVDSAVLILSYGGLYGDSMQPLRLTVSEISQSTPLYDSIAYPVNYPNLHPFTLAQQLAPVTTIDIRRLTDSVNNRFENAKNQIRIKMNQSVARRFIKDYDSTNYKTDSLFTASFAGFAVTADAGAPANALLKINLADTNTKFALYYSSSTTGATKRDTAVSYFRFNAVYGGSGDANYVVRDRSGSEAGRHISAAPKSDSLVYVQTSPGTRVKIRVPGLEALSNRIIHRAELIAEQVPDDANLATIETFMIPPRYLLLTVWDSANGGGKRNVPNDYVMSSEGPNISNFGGFVTSKAATGYEKITAYNFNVSRYVQGIVTRKDTTFNFLLSAPTNDSMKYIPPYPANVITPATFIFLNPSIGNDLGDGRVRLGGGTHSRFRMRLRVVYSRI